MLWEVAVCICSLKTQNPDSGLISGVLPYLVWRQLVRLEPVCRESEGTTQQLTADPVAPDVCLGFLHEIAMEDALHEVNEILERKDINEKHNWRFSEYHGSRFYNP